MVSLPLLDMDMVEWYGFLNLVEGDREGIIFKLLYHLGCSESELLSIKVKDIDFHKNAVSIGSRNSRIPDKLLSDIRRFVSEHSPDDFVLRGRSQGHMSAKRLQQIVSEISEKIKGTKITPQDIRYYHVSHALFKGISPASISKQTGMSYQRVAQIMESMRESLEAACHSYEL